MHEIVTDNGNLMKKKNELITLSVIGVVAPRRSSSGSGPGISSRFILGYTKVSGEPTPITLSMLPGSPPIAVDAVSTVRLHEPTASCCWYWRMASTTHGVVIDATVFAAAPITTPCRRTVCSSR